MEPRGQLWELRAGVANALRRAGHSPWLWEEQGEEDLRTGGGTPQEVISRGIRTADLVTTFYKTRAGSLIGQTPFHGTDYEIVEAVRLGVPFRLYVVKDHATYRLKSVLSLFGDRVIIGNEPRFCRGEDEVVAAVLSDAEEVRLSKLTQTAETVLLVPAEHPWPSEWLDEMLVRLSTTVDHEHYHTAAALLRNLPLVWPSPSTRYERIQVARLLGVCANVYANRGSYEMAGRVAARGIRLLMHAGAWEEMFGQIQALSGILNMAGMDRARWLNAYGFRAATHYSNLAGAFRDSRASILRDLGRYEQAWRLLDSDREKSPYSAAKYAHVMAFARRGRHLEEARTFLEDRIVPWARSEKRSIAYVLREASFLSLRDGDITSALSFLGEAEQLCKVRGLVHTLGKLRELRRQIVQDGGNLGERA